MKRAFFAIIIFAAGAICCNAAAKSCLYVIDQKCENMHNPLGINTTLPRLSWKLSSTRQGDRQTAYEIEMASSKEQLLAGHPDLWRSGKIMSSNSILVDYGGTPLRPRDMVYWRVRPYDAKGKAGEWSPVARFSIGITDGAVMEGSYIGMAGENPERRAPIFRKKVNLNGSRPVMAYVNSLGYHELYVNGMKVDEHVLQPAVSELNKRSLIVTYDISGFVKAGENDIVVWAGQGWYKESSVKNIGMSPLLKVEIDEQVNDVWKKTAATDGSWLVSDSGYRDLGDWNSWNFIGEKVDGSIVPQSMDASSLDMLKWENAVVADVSGIQATPQMFPGNSIISVVKPKKIEKIAEKEWMVDLGRVITGWFAMEMTGLQSGDMVRMEYADHMKDDGSLVSQKEHDEYLAAGKNSELFCNKFNHHAYRYVKISGVENLSEARGVQISGDYAETSSFKCSDKDLNTVHDLIHYTIRCLAFSGYMVDCPHIERRGYGGDGNSSTLTFQTMYDVTPTYDNWLQAWRDVIQPDGSLPHVAPLYRCGGGPYWCSFVIKAPWMTYKNYGDRKALSDNYSVMCRWLDFVKQHSPDGLLRKWPDTDHRSWYLGDWIAAGGVNVTDSLSIDMVNNCCISECLAKMTEIATLLGKSGDAERFKQWRTDLNQRIHSAFYHADDSTYASRAPIDMAYALNAGVMPAELQKAVSDKLLRLSRGKYRSHIAVGLTGVPVFTEWAVRERETDLMADILRQHDDPSYLYMVDHGATATWEYWSGNRSYVHNCFNGIGSWFYEALAGIGHISTVVGQEPGIVISPQFAHGVDWVKATRETPYGQVAVAWKRTDGKILLSVEIPVGLTVPLSAVDAKIVKINGKKYHGGKRSSSLPSGKYEIVCEE